jgi:predicted unusual protein kinase regulating ubiquinone biosynthesis (AarF/ABC1/UbiB family)
VADDELITSAVHRVLRLGGLAGRVGASVLGNQIAGLVRSTSSRRARRSDNLIRNASRVVETLGELKGAAMKVGQMLSLHDGLLPPEVAAVLRTLQKEAPHVPAEVMEDEVRTALEDLDRVFESLDFEAHAAASIGQVHVGRLRDGRRVAVKIQYPLIDHIVKADLKNLRTVLKTLFGLISDVDFEPIWRELRDRLLEELDYTVEAANMRRMAALHAGIPEIVIPRVVEEASTKSVLTMEYLEGLAPADACSATVSQKLRDRWGAVLFEFLFRGLLEHRLLHADPNLANFAFLEDGRVIVYDFGCVKHVPESVARGYARLLLAVLEGRTDDVPRALRELGISKKGRAALPVELTDPYVGIFAPIFRKRPRFRFGEDEDLYRKLLHLSLSSWSQAMDVRVPHDIVFIQRTLAGHLGNLIRLNATGPWRELALAYASAASEPNPGTR